MAEKETKPKAKAKEPETAKTAPKATKPATSTSAKKTQEKPTANKTPKKTETKPAAKAETDKPKAASDAGTTAKKAPTAVKAKNAASDQSEKKPTAKTTSPAAPAKPKKAVAQNVAPAEEKSVPAKQTGNKEKTAGGGFVAALTKNKMRTILLSAVAFLLIVALIVGIAVGAKSCGKDDPFSPPNKPTSVLQPTADPVQGDKPTHALGSNNKPLISPVEEVEGDCYENQYSTTTAVGFSGVVTANTERIRPVDELKDEGLPSGYPKFGYTLQNVIGSDPEKVAARNALISEANYMCATGTRNAGSGGGYTWMDQNGFLYSGTTAEPVETLDSEGRHRQLYKHTAAVGMYFGDVADDEPGIVKSVTIRPRSYNSYSVTGVYAPAGEVIKIEISEADMNATGGITIHIGQALYNGQANNIWAEKGQMQRFPVILNTMTVNKNTATLKNGVYTAYVGSFVGGPLYIRNTSASFTATISGGVAYSHFILGYTTKEEFEENKQSSAPYFDLEVWNYGVLHSGPKSQAQNFTYEDLYKAAVLWEKVSSVTTTGSSQGIVFLYEPFVAAGAAVAFPGRSSVNCPTGWMANSLNYNTIVSSGGWGNFHEYHHNFQGYGVGNGGEVTNNGMTLVSYALFTKISSKRGISNFGAEGLGGWNNYTSATLALEETLKIARNENPSNGKQGLALYATLLHNFGANNYIQAKVQQQSHGYGQTYTGYLKAWQDITHNDMTYFFKDVLQGIDKKVAAEHHNPDYPTFVPVSSVYQTGRSYTYDGEKRYFNTMQPYVIPYGKEFNIDLGKYTAPNGQYQSGSIVIPEGFDYKIKSITKPAHGTLEIVDAYNFKFKPDTNLRSGQIIVTLEITKKDKAFQVDNVDLVLEFEQSHETNKMVLTRNTYAYTAETMYSDAQTAYENGYKGFETHSESDHGNPTQNCNTDIWYYPNTQENHEKYPNAPDWYFVPENTVVELSGKLYFDEAGKYRIYLRGRMNCAMYYSTDGGKTYSLGATIKDASVPSNSAAFRPSDSRTYVDLQLAEHSWVHFKSVLIVQPTPVISYIGLGTSKWTEPMFTIVTKHYDIDNNEVPSEQDENYHHSVTHYYDYQGNEVTEEEANRAELIPPTSASYVNAYRSDYEFPSNSGFETDYFYTRTYGYTYSTKYDDLQQSIVGDPQCPPNYPIENLFDNDLNTACSSPAIVSPQNPWELTVDLGKTIKANRFVLTGRLNNGAANQNQTPNSITLYLGETAETLREIISFDNGTVNGITLQFNFEDTSFRYYRLVVRKTVQGRFAAIGNIEFSNNIPNGIQFSPDEEAFAFTGNWQSVQAHSTFGHVYKGSSGSKLLFNFNGKRLALLSSKAYGRNFDVYIDGKKMNSIELKTDSHEYGASYISDLLDETTHSVEIRCTGEANIDSIVIFE
jgi:hypothetical protein